MQNIVKNVVVAVKGFFMGAANVVPGVSGGTIALITGIYDEIIEALNSFTDKETWKDIFHGRWKEFWTAIHGTFLLSLGIGVVLSVFSLAKLMEYVLAHHPVQTWAFFFGLIIASSVIMFRGIKKWHFSDVIFAIVGAILGVVVCTLTPTTTPDSWWFIFICGAIAVCTMILPGISGSFILVIFSKYDYIMSAVANLDIPVLAIFALGCIVGILAFAKLLHWLLARYEKQTMLILLGFVLGSLIKVWPWSDRAAIEASQGVAAGAPIELHVAGAVIWCVIGVALVLGIELLGRKVKKSEE
jgi:Predicted membrane protein